MAVVQPAGAETTTPSAAADADLMRQLGAGQMSALGELYRRYNAVVCAMLYAEAPWLLPGEIEDLGHDVFLSLVDAARRYEEHGKLRAYLCSIAARTARNHRRKHWLRRTFAERFRHTTAQQSPPEQHAVVAARERLTLALKAVSSEQRAVLVLYLVEHQSCEEIADTLGIQPKTVWTRLHRARLAIRTALGESP